MLVRQAPSQCSRSFSNPIALIRALRRSSLEICPSTEAMISAAISSKQAALVRFLLSNFTGYPTDWSEARCRSQKPISFGSSIVRVVLDSPDIETLQVLLDYDHDLANFEFDDHTTFLSQACQRDPDKIGPLI